MPYWQLFYHIVWATKNRLPLITPELEPTVYDFLRTKAIGLGATVFALNGIADHVHLVASVPPKIAVAQFVGQIKAVTATKFNKSFTKSVPLYWQEQYGVFSFDSKRLPNFAAYVENQKQHHAAKTMIPILERCDDADVQLLHESSNSYGTDYDAWLQDMAER